MFCQFLQQTKSIVSTLHYYAGHWVGILNILNVKLRLFPCHYLGRMTEGQIYKCRKDKSSKKNKEKTKGQKWYFEDGEISQNAKHFRPFVFSTFCPKTKPERLILLLDDKLKFKRGFLKYLVVEAIQILKMNENKG